MSSLMMSSMAEEAMCVFSALQVTSLPMSSMLVVIESRLVVVFPSTDTCSSACFNRVTPIHQVIVAGGREPDEVHSNVETLSADKGLPLFAILTPTGRTVANRKK